MIKYPWPTKCLDYNFSFELPESIDIKGLNLSKKIILPSNFGLITKKLIITFSNSSSVFDDIHIDYCEMIIKVVIEYNEKEYVYPLVAVVNNELSLIRGYFLGFNKTFAFVSMTRDKIILEHNNKKMIIKISDYQPLLHKIETYPFILERDYDFGGGLKRKDVVSLDVEKYSCKEIGEFKCEFESNTFLTDIGIDCIIDEPCFTFCAEEDFILIGTKEIRSLL